MLDVCAEMQRVLKAGCGQVFLLTGNVRDSYPHPLDSRDAELYTLAELLRLSFPEHLFVQLGLSIGLQTLSEKDAERFQKEVLGRTEQSPTNPLAAALQNMQQPSGSTIATDPLAGLTTLRQAFAQERVPIMAFMPRLETLVANHASTDRTARLVIDHLLDLAEDDGIAKRGHLLVLVASDSAETDEQLFGCTSRIVQLRIGRPNEEERREFFGRLTVTEEHRERCEELTTKIQHQIEGYVEEQRRNIQTWQTETSKLKKDLSSVTAPTNLLRRQIELADKVDQLKKEQLELFGGRLKQELERNLQQIQSTEETLLKRLRNQKISVEMWRNLRVGDQLCGFITNIGLVSFRVTHVYRDRRIELSKAYRRNLSDIADDVEGSMCSMKTEAPFSGKTLRFIFSAELDMVLGYEFGGCAQIAFWLPKRNQEDTGPQFWLYVLSGQANPGDIQSDIDQLNEIEPKRFKFKDMLKRLEAGEEVEHEAVNQIATTIQATEKQLADLGQEIENVVEAQRLEIQKTIAEHERKQGAAEELITDALGAQKKLPKRFKQNLVVLTSELDRLRSGRFAPPTADLVQLARLSNGLGHRHLRDLLAMAEVQGDQLDETAIFKARSRKLTESFGHLAEVVDARWGFESIGGLEHVKDELRAIARNMRNGNYRAVPQGMLLMGPPGTGKSIIAEALAHETGYAYIRVKTLRDMYVGVSEKQTDALLAFVREAAPLIIERDEVDEEDSGRDSYQGDSGVSGRIRRAWMTFMADPATQGRVLVLAITNRPDRLDAALTRSARMDYRIPILMPNREARTQIFQVMFRVWYKIDTEITDFTKYADLTVGLPGSDIRFIVQESEKWAARNGRTVVEDADLLEAIHDVRPSVNQEVVEEWSRLAVKQASNIRFIPPEWRDKLSGGSSAQDEDGRRDAKRDQGDHSTSVVVVPVAIGRSGGKSGQGSGTPPASNSSLN